MLLLFFLSFGIVYGLDECDKTPRELKACNLTSICKSAPVCNTTTGCPDCFPLEILRSSCKSSRDLESCKSDEKPKLKWSMKDGHVSLCPTCLPAPPDSSECAGKMKECATKIKNRDIRFCHNGAKPYKDNCCFSCLPYVNKTKCKVVKCDYSKAKDCKDGEQSKRENCCRSCRNKIKGKVREGKCSKEDFKAAIQATPECEGDEKPFTDESVKHCGPSCRRAESGYKLVDVIDCLKARAECAADVEPFTLPGSRCAACDKPRRKCDKECAEGKVCVVKVKNETMKKERCISRKALKLKFKAKGLLKKTLMKVKSLDKVAVVKVILEMVARFCERNSEAKRCKKFANVIRETLKCKNKKDSDDSVEVELEVGNESDEWEDEATGRRLLAGDDAAGLLQDAAADDDSLELDSSSPDDSGANSQYLISSMVFFIPMLFSI